MNNLIVFDFDGTLININHLHKEAWKQVLEETGLEVNLAKYLPKEKYLMQRFDSPDRIKEHFFKSSVDQNILEFFFNTKDKDHITSELLDLKESHMLHLLNALSPSEMAQLYAKNIFQGLDLLLDQQNRLGIISNTRESIILTALRVCRLDDCFSFIIGDESLYSSYSTPLLKQDVAVRAIIPSSISNGILNEKYYIGDDSRIDSALARNYGFRFVQTTKDTDFTTIKDLI